MKIKSGDLDRRVTVLDLITSRDDDNMPQEAWRPIGTYWMGFFPLLAREAMSQAGREAVAEGKLLTRYKALLRPTMRLRCGETLYAITGIEEIGRRAGQWLFATMVTE